MELRQLYQKALALQKLELWKKLEDSQIFAVKVRDQICYIDILGMLGESFALAVYPGQEAMDRLWRIIQTEEDDLEYLAAGFGRIGLHCEFELLEEFSEEEQKDLRAWAKAENLSLDNPRDRWPHFLKYRPYRVPGPVRDAEDLEILAEALDAAVFLAGKMGKNIRKLAFLHEPDETLPLLSREGDAFRIEKIPMPPEPEVCYPIGHTPNELYMARTKRLPKKGNWFCELTVYPKPLEADGMDEQVIPWQLLTADSKSGKGIQVQMVRDYETRTEVMLDKLMEAMFRENVCPASITVADDRTYSLLEDWTAEMKIDLLTDEDKPEAIIAMEAKMMAESDPAGAVEDMLDYFLMIPEQALPPEQLAFLLSPQFNLQEIQDLPGISDTILKKIALLQKKIDNLRKRVPMDSGLLKKKTGKKKSKLPEQTLVISVSYDTGCYRHLRISSKATLEDLSSAILNAFAFDNDHLHAFFMDNRIDSLGEIYYSREMEDDPPFTDEILLEEVASVAGKKFKYLFDFGDNWIFQCKVLKVLDEKTGKPEVVRSKGEAPEQYPAWDEDDDWDDDE